MLIHRETAKVTHFLQFSKIQNFRELKACSMADFVFQCLKEQGSFAFS